MKKRALALLLVACVLPAPAFAGALNIDCRYPFVFNKAAVNVVLLPYTNTGDSPRIDETSRQLSLLTQIDALFGIVKFGSVGAVQHVHVSTAPAAIAECAPGIVMDKLLGRKPGATATIENGHGVVLLWGRFYEERGAIYLQSYVRFERRGVPAEGFTATLDGQPIGGQVSSSSFAFSPRLMTRADLVAIRERFVSTVKLHDGADAASPTTSMALGGERPFKYWVTDVRGNWMRLSASGAGPEGWVQADSKMEEWSLRRLLPELTFVEGIAGFLSTRVTSANPTALEARRTRAAGALTRALDVFATPKYEDRSGAPLPDVVGRQLLGLLSLSDDSPAAALDQAITRFDAARERAPHDANARNLVASARLLRAARYAAPVERPEGYVDEYLAIVALEPRNAAALRNLESVLELLAREIGREPKFFGPTSLAAVDVQKRLAAVRAIRKSLAVSGNDL